MKRILAAISILFSASGFAAVSQGEYVARASDCVACHTVDGGQAMAGGKKFSTPVGDIYSTNITPDKNHGIGSYSYEDFEKAVRRGIAKDGHALYPAMPYPSYAKMTDEDVKALYDYFMKEVTPAATANKENDIPLLLSARWPLRVWNGLFVDDVKSGGEVVEAHGDNAEKIKRGAYLVQGPGHCGACHTPRGMAMQEKGYDDSSPEFLSGAMIDGWYAPSLRGMNMSTQEVKDLLSKGRSQHHAIAGPMGEVVTQSTQYLTDADLEAIALYIANFKPQKNAATAVNAAVFSSPPDGKTLYMRYCSTCHSPDGKGTDFNVPSLVGNSAVMAKDPSSLIRVIADGAHTPQTQGNIPFMMPGYKGVLSDKEMTDVVNYVRGSWGNGAPAATEDEVKKIAGEGK
ncbi:cytochrome c [Cedecea neteri]|uniref:cytochrome c n=1 Tax=Cedecea neteri TaxID=158822 RepID=UPI002AA73564|nr:cytochrome c [Cedecea neteri]WPU21684.1 cytochrome c [Cedecea neteri]